MKTMKLFFSAFLLIFSCPSWSQPESGLFDEDEEAALVQLLLDGQRLVEAGNPREAITKYFDKVLLELDAKYDRSEMRIYCARSPDESFLYLLTGTMDEQSTVVLSSTWADAHFIKGYALLELGRLAEAKSFIEQAVALSPNYSQYLAELGHIHQLEKDWQGALQYFQKAESFIDYSPPEVRAFQLGVARRGSAYTLVELGRFDEAEEKYLQCLSEDPGDVRAKNELEYVRNLQRNQ